MKKILKYSFFFVVFLAISYLSCVFISDPYNIFHWRNIRNHGINPNHNYVKTKYILSTPNKFDGFIFGSSRVGAIHVENITDAKIYNLTASGGLPKEHLDTLQTFIDGNVKMDTIYVSIDSYSYTETPEVHYKDPLSVTYEFLKDNPKAFIQLYMSPSRITQGFKAFKTDTGVEGYDTFYEYGWWCDYDRISTFDPQTAVPFIGAHDFRQETLDIIRTMKQLCEEHRIKLVVFTNPMYDITYRVSLEKDYLIFLKELAEITDYYNFSGLNDVTLNPDYFLDASHYTAPVGDMIISSMVYNQTDETLYEQGFGWHVTPDNIDDLLLILQ